jgi:hypothetical protein
MIFTAYTAIGYGLNESCAEFNSQCDIVHSPSLPNIQMTNVAEKKTMYQSNAIIFLL